MKNDHDRIDAEIARVSQGSDPFAAAVRATRMPMLITDPNKDDNPIVFVNDAFSRLTGYRRDEILGRNCRFLQGPETNSADVERIRDAIRRRVAIEIELLNHKKTGEVFWNRLLISPVFDDQGSLTYFFASQFDVTLERDRMVRLQRDRDKLETEVADRTADVTRGEQHLKFVLNAGRLGAWTLHLDDYRLIASDVCKLNFGFSPGDPFTYSDLLDAIAVEDRDRMKSEVQASIESGNQYDVEYRINTPSGERRWLHIRGQAFFRADGTPLTMAGVSIDITERKRSEEHRMLLTAELNHRVKNSMAMVQSIAHQTLRSAKTLEEAEKTLDARIISLAAAHDVLTRENWESASLTEVVREALRPFTMMGADRFWYGGPEIRLPPSRALALSLALHEMATNAVKYGALTTANGRVLLNWDIDRSQQPHRFRLQWEEIGGPTVVAPKARGFGIQIIERNLAAEFNGKAAINFRPNGVVLTVNASLPVQGEN